MLDWPKQRTFSIPVHLLRASRPGRCGIARQSKATFRSWWCSAQRVRIETFKYRGSELICEACGPDFRTAMIHTAAGGIAIDEPWTAKKRIAATAD